MQDEEKALETLMSRRTALQAKRSELERKIKDLGSLPSEAFEKYHDHTLADLRKLLHKANTQLKKFRYGCFRAQFEAVVTLWLSGACSHPINLIIGPNVSARCNYCDHILTSFRKLLHTANTQLKNFGRAVET